MPQVQHYATFRGLSAGLQRYLGFMDHPSHESIEKYCQSKLAESAMAAVGEHLSGCRECRDRTKATRIYLAALKQAAEELKLRNTRNEIDSDRD